MQKRKIGSLEVSPIGMGCMGFSHGYGAIPSESYSIEAIQKGHDAGCTFFDTAEIYGPNLALPGHNERIVGKALRAFRRDVAIATKLHVNSHELQERSLYEVIRSHLLLSLERLQTDWVDLYYLHRVNPAVPVEDVAGVMGQLVREGLIREWGLSQVDVSTLKRAHEVCKVAAVQNLYNMMERDCEAELFPHCIEENIALVSFSPIASGLLSGKISATTQFEKVDDVRNFVPQLSRSNLVSNLPLVDALAEFAAKKGATSAQIALAWQLKKYPNVVPIPGSKNQQRILENLAAWNVTLSDEEFCQLEQLLSCFAVHGHRGTVEYEGKSFLQGDSK